jgi:hypothetical protein
VARHAIAGRRPGETYYTPVGRIHTDPIDGGARLTDAQRAYFEGEGYELVAVGDAAPETKPSEPDPKAQAEIAANQEAAQEVLALNRVDVPKAPAKPARGK